MARPVLHTAATATRASSATRSGSRTRSACWRENRAVRRHHAAGRGHAAREPQPEVVRHRCARSSRRSSTTGSAARSSTTPSSSRSRATSANVAPLRPFARGVPPLPDGRDPGVRLRQAGPRTPIRGRTTRGGANTGLPDIDTVADRSTLGAVRLLHHRGAVLRPAIRVGPTMQVRLDAHGVAQRDAAVRAHHPARAAAARADPDDVRHGVGRRPSPIVPGLRLTECPHITAAERSYSKTLLEGKTASDTLAIGNIAPEVNEPLNWTITEAVSDCASPSDLPWVSHVGDLRLGAPRPAAPRTCRAELQHRRDQRQHHGHRGALPRQSNDAGEALITIPVSLAIRSLLADIAAVRAALASHSPLSCDARAARRSSPRSPRSTTPSPRPTGTTAFGPTRPNGRTVFDTLVPRRPASSTRSVRPGPPVRGRLARRSRPRRSRPSRSERHRCRPNKDKAIKELQRGDHDGQRRAQARVLSPCLGLGPRGTDRRLLARDLS